MLENGVLWILIAVNCLATYYAFQDISIFERYKLQIGAVLQRKQYDRIITSSFLHGDYIHLIFNMLSLYFFAPIIIETTSSIFFLIVYFLSVVGGSLFAIFNHKNQNWYSAVGASGGVTGIVFASICMFPHMKMGLLILPIMIPAWIFAILYLLYSIYGMKAQNDNIGHEAHVGGAILGMLAILVYHPQVIIINGLYIGIICIPIAYFVFLTFNNRK